MYPRKGSVLYSLTKSRKEAQKREIKKWKRMNMVVVFLYLSGILPFFAGGIFLLLTTKGRKTGKMRTTPLEYRKRNGIIHVFAARGKKADWFKNLIANPDDAIVRIRFRKFSPQIKVIGKWKEKEEIIRWYIHEYPRAAKFLFGWDPKTDDSEETDISSLLQLFQIIQIREHPTKLIHSCITELNS